MTSSQYIVTGIAADVIRIEKPAENLLLPAVLTNGRLYDVMTWILFTSRRW